MRKLKLMVICTVIAVAIMVTYSSELKVKAQAFHRIYSGGLINDLTWSADGSLLSFNEGDDLVVSTTTNVWHEYNPSTQTLTTPVQWPRQPNLSSGEITLYKPATEKWTFSGTLEDYDSFIFSSPDDDYIVFASNIGANDRGFPMYIADRQNQTVAETYTEAWDPTRGLQGINVIWNRTNTAFVVSADLPQGGEFSHHVQAHVSNFSTVLTDLEMTSTEEIIIDGHNYWATEAYSVSDDGDSVLLRAIQLNRATSTATYYLIVWNVSTNTSTIIGDMDAEKIRTAAFDNGDPDEILMFNNTGIVRYTVSTDDTEIITTEINADWAVPNYPTQAAFSSDGQWLAVTRAEGASAVYVFNLLEDFVGLKVQYYPESTTRTQFSEIIAGQFNIVNTSDVDVDLSDLTIRYFFSRDTAQPLQAVCSWTALPNECDDVVVTAGAWASPTSDSYMEIGFTAGTLAANSETQDIIARVNKQDYSDFDQDNDYSFDPDSNSDTFIDWRSVALYYNGKMVWGIEPH